MGKAAKEKKNKTIPKRKTIKKPKYLHEFLKCGAVCLVITLGISWFMLYKKLESINDDYEDTYQDQVNETKEILMKYWCEKYGNPTRYAKFLNIAEEQIYELSAASGPMARVELWINGEKAFETPQGYFASLGICESGDHDQDKTEYYFLEDESYLTDVMGEPHSDSSPTYRHDAFSHFFHSDDEVKWTGSYYDIDTFFVNKETHRFIPEIVYVHEVKELDVVETKMVNCSPTVPDGYERMNSRVHMTSALSGYYPDDASDHELVNSFRLCLSVPDPDYVNTFPDIELKYSDYEDFTLMNTLPYETRIFTAGAVLLGIILGLLTAAIRYNRKKSVWAIFEYRKSTTQAMAHDLKTPLATISAYAESMEDASPEQQNMYAGKIRENVSEMNRMVENILHFSRSETGGQVSEKTDVDVEKIVRESLEKSKGLFDKNCVLTSVHTDGSCIVNTDEPMLRQAIENLVSNCAKYAASGSETEVRIEEKKITFRNQTAQEIKDVESLKQPFVKGDGARGENGTGLGLAIADNNLSILGYKLKLSCENGWFEAQVLFEK